MGGVRRAGRRSAEEESIAVSVITLIGGASHLLMNGFRPREACTGGVSLRRRLEVNHDQRKSVCVCGGGSDVRY